MRIPAARLLLPLILLSGLSLARPTPAGACIWNILDYFLPWPPCKIKDEPVLHRVRQANARLAAVLFETAEKIKMVKREIYQWERAYRTATNFENQLRSVYGDLTANPLPSLVYTWNRTGIGSYVQLKPDGTLGVSFEIVDFREAADSIANAFLNEVDIQRIYAESWAPELDRLRRVVEQTAVKLERELTHLGDYRRQTQAFRDSLQNLGNRFADRYTGNAEAVGDAEAHISHLSLQLSKLRGTAFHAQYRGISNRLKTLGYAAEAEALLHKNDGARLSLFVW